jgi:DNA modification methylase
LRKETGEEKFGKGLVHNEDFFEGSRRLENGSVLLMVTSPPYLNNYHYARNTRPQLYWLGLISSPGEQKHLEEKNFGTFWQIARTKDSVALNFAHPELEDILARLRQLHPEKGEYGGHGWASYAASYFNDCERFLREIKRCLSKKGTGVIVVGNFILQGINIKVQDFLGDIAKMCGLKLVGVYRLRDKRIGDSITGSSVRGASSKARLDESAVVVQKH